jgi:hypothetical protein
MKIGMEMDKIGSEIERGKEWEGKWWAVSDDGDDGDEVVVVVGVRVRVGFMVGLWLGFGLG